MAATNWHHFGLSSYMKVIQLIPGKRRSEKKTLFDKLIAQYQKAGEEVRLRFLRNNPAYNGYDGLIA